VAANKAPRRRGRPPKSKAPAQAPAVKREAQAVTVKPPTPQPTPEPTPTKETHGLEGLHVEPPPTVSLDPPEDMRVVILDTPEDPKDRPGPTKEEKMEAATAGARAIVNLGLEAWGSKRGWRPPEADELAAIADPSLRVAVFLWPDILDVPMIWDVAAAASALGAYAGRREGEAQAARKAKGEESAA